MSTTTENTPEQPVRQYSHISGEIMKPSLVGCDPKTQANTDRIVNCVNACAGIPDPQTAIPALLGRLGSTNVILEGLLQTVHRKDDLAQIKAHLNENRKALAAARGEMPGD